MMQWISAHSSALTVAANFTMVGIWLIYLQLFWKSYRRQLRANVLITPGAGTGLEARCLVSNMSAEAVFIAGIFLVLEKNGQRWSTALTNITRVREGGEAQRQADRVMHQGPLPSAAYVDIGEFGDLLERARETVGPGDTDRTSAFDAFEIWAIAEYSAERRLVSVRRKFAVVSKDGRVGLRPEEVTTDQVRRGRRRRQLERMLEDHVSGLSD